MMTRFLTSLALALLGAISTTHAANILWVSDAAPAGFSGPGLNLTDQGFVTLLQNAGHNVNRFNGPDSQNTLLTQVEINAINTNDLIILGRACGSGAWRAPQGLQWNTNVIKPLICMSPYLVRTIAGADNRMGWFTAGNLPDDVPTRVGAVAVADPETDYIVGGVPMLGTSTALLYDELLDRNTSHITDPVVAGGTVLLSATFPRESDGVSVTANVIAEFPAGTVATLGSAPLAGYRMYLAGGSRESATAPNSIPLYTGRENLTPTGESIFLRAVEVALNNGVAPTVPPSTPIGFTLQPLSATVLHSLPVSFSVAVTGAAPRTLQWQRDTGDGVTFTNIPDANTPFSMSLLTLPGVSTNDHGARFRVEASNPNNSVFSDVATLTVTPDTNAPVPLSAASFDGTTIGICFDELLDTNAVNNSATDAFNYSLSGGLTVNSVTMGADGRSVTLNLSAAVGATFTVTIINVQDRLGNALSATGVDLPGMNLGLTGIDVGALNPAGSQFAWASNSLQVSGGGLDIVSASDQLRFTYQPVDGDFDARVRVSSLVGSDRLESVAKAILMARDSLATDAAGVTVFVTPPAPGDNSMVSHARSTAGAATNLMGTPVVPSGLPNAWMRIKRAGDVFTTYHSTNGVDWIEFGAVSIAFPPSLNVGVGVVSHRNGRLATATFTDFQTAPPAAAIVLVNPTYIGGTFSAAFETQNGVTYTIQYKDNLSVMTWNTLTTVSGDGTLKTFTDPGPVSSTGSRFYQVIVP